MPLIAQSDAGLTVLQRLDPNPLILKVCTHVVQTIVSAMTSLLHLKSIVAALLDMH